MAEEGAGKEFIARFLKKERRYIGKVRNGSSLRRTLMKRENAEQRVSDLRILLTEEGESSLKGGGKGFRFSSETPPDIGAAKGARSIGRNHGDGEFFWPGGKRSYFMEEFRARLHAEEGSSITAGGGASFPGKGRSPFLLSRMVSRSIEEAFGLKGQRGASGKNAFNEAFKKNAALNFFFGNGCIVWGTHAIADRIVKCIAGRGFGRLSTWGTWSQFGGRRNTSKEGRVKALTGRSDPVGDRIFPWKRAIGRKILIQHRKRSRAHLSGAKKSSFGFVINEARKEETSSLKEGGPQGNFIGGRLWSIPSATQRALKGGNLHSPEYSGWVMGRERRGVYIIHYGS